MKSFEKYLMMANRGALIALLAAMAIIIFSNVILRYSTNQSIEWAEEEGHQAAEGALYRYKVQGEQTKHSHCSSSTITGRRESYSRAEPWRSRGALAESQRFCCPT